MTNDPWTRYDDDTIDAMDEDELRKTTRLLSRALGVVLKRRYGEQKIARAIIVDDDVVAGVMRDGPAYVVRHFDTDEKRREPKGGRFDVEP